MPLGGGEKRTPMWAQQREALLRDCIVSPDVFTSMVERLGDFVVPYQRALETEASQRNVTVTSRGCCRTSTAIMPRKFGPSRCRATGHPRLHRYCTMGSSPVDRGPGRPRDRAVGEPDGVIAFGNCIPKVIKKYTDKSIVHIGLCHRQYSYQLRIDTLSRKLLENQWEKV